MTDTAFYKIHSLESLPSEVWREIPGYETRYLASSLGRIKAIERYGRREHICKQGFVSSSKSNDYLRICLYKKGFTKQHYTSHRIIASAFLPEITGKKYVNHKNGLKWDNRVVNLERCSASENRKHAHDTGLHNGMKGEKHPMSKYTKEQIVAIWDDLQSGVYRSFEIAKRNKVPPQVVCDIKKGRRWRHLFNNKPQ